MVRAFMFLGFEGDIMCGSSAFQLVSQRAFERRWAILRNSVRFLILSVTRFGFRRRPSRDWCHVDVMEVETVTEKET